MQIIGTAIIALNQLAQIDIENDPINVNVMSTVSHNVNGNIESILPKSIRQKIKTSHIVKPDLTL